MCPACLGAAAWAIAGTTSAGGVAALVFRTLRPKDDRPSRQDKNGAQDKPGDRAADPE